MGYGSLSLIPVPGLREGTRDQRTPSIHWPVSISKLISSVRDPVPKNKVELGMVVLASNPSIQEEDAGRSLRI